MLRPPEVDDQDFIHHLNSDPVVRGNVVGWDWPASLHGQLQWFDTVSSGTTHRWIVADEDNNRIGLTGLWDVDWHNRNAMTALKLGGKAPLRGRGLGTDAIKAVMAFAFYDVGLNRLHGSILESNRASVAAYVDKCGWTVEGRSRQHVWRHGRYVDLLQVGVLKADFDKLPGSDEYVELLINGSESRT